MRAPLALIGWPRAHLLSVGLLGAAVLGGCAVGPDYHAPAARTVTPQNLDARYFSTAAPIAAWWRQFGDPELASLEQRAAQNNLDLQTALARVAQARAVFGGTVANFAPHVPVETTYTRSKEQLPGFTDQRIDINSYTVGFDASWEFDLFGRTRRAAQAAGAELQGEQAALADVQVRVTAEVARNYFELRGVQRQLDVVRGNLDNQREALRLSQVRYEAGRVTELDVDSALSRLHATEATVPLLEAQEKAYDYRLAVLLGLLPGALDGELHPLPVRAWSAALPVGDVSQLLRRRPDVREAERELAAATARIGVATADLFPRVSLAGFVGFLAGDSSQLGEANSRAWSLTPTVTWSALDFPTVLSRVHAARAQQQQALAQYRQTVLAAIEDFENACVNYAKQQQRLGSLTAQAEASRRAARLAQIQYREGSVDFLVLLDAQRTLLEAEASVAMSEAEVNTGAVAVYKALGGWTVTTSSP